MGPAQRADYFRVAGEVKFHDIIEGVTMKEERDQLTGQGPSSCRVKEDLHPQVVILMTKASLWRITRFRPGARNGW